MLDVFIIIAILLAAIVAVNVRSHRKQTKIAKLRSRVQRALDGDMEMLDSIFDPPSNKVYSLARAGGKKLVIQLEGLSIYKRDRDQVAERYAAWHIADHSHCLDRLSAGLRLAEGLSAVATQSALARKLIETRQGFSAEEVGELTKDRVNAAFKLAELHHPRERIEELVRARRMLSGMVPARGHILKLWGFRLGDIEHPPNWNTLVAESMVDPQFDDFVVSDAERQELASNARLLTAETCSDNEFVRAKIILALCEADPKVKAKVGDGLLRDLAYCIVRDPVQQKLIGSTQEAPA